MGGLYALPWLGLPPSVAPNSFLCAMMHQIFTHQRKLQIQPSFNAFCTVRPVASYNKSYGGGFQNPKQNRHLPGVFEQHCCLALASSSQASNVDTSNRYAAKSPL
jgi:hypothetical protein